jgi:hypothetical protein
VSEQARDDAPVVRTGDPDRPYRRRIRLVRTDGSTVWGGLEDDFHHFEVTLTHGANHVTGIAMEAWRWPWATCPDAGRNLTELVGMELSSRCTAVAEVSDPHWHCTHQFDLAGLCVAHAARGTERREYEVALEPDGAVIRPRLWRDGELVLEWTLAGHAPGRVLVDASPPFDTAPWKGGFIRWADATLPTESAEAAIVLRRACDIGMGRGMDLEAIDVSEQLAGIMSGVCYSMQPSVMPVAFRNRGSIRDFGDRPDALLRGRHEG